MKACAFFFSLYFEIISINEFFITLLQSKRTFQPQWYSKRSFFIFNCWHRYWKCSWGKTLEISQCSLITGRINLSRPPVIHFGLVKLQNTDQREQKRLRRYLLWRVGGLFSKCMSLKLANVFLYYKFHHVYFLCVRFSHKIKMFSTNKY